MHILVMYWRLIKGLFNKSKHLFLEIGSKCKRMPMCHSGAKMPSCSINAKPGTKWNFGCDTRFPLL